MVSPTDCKNLWNQTLLVSQAKHYGDSSFPCGFNIPGVFGVRVFGVPPVDSPLGPVSSPPPYPHSFYPLWCKPYILLWRVCSANLGLLSGLFTLMCVNQFYLWDKVSLGSSYSTIFPGSLGFYLCRAILLSFDMVNLCFLKRICLCNLYNFYYKLLNILSVNYINIGWYNLNTVIFQIYLTWI